MNSFNFIARGIEAEVARQIGVWESGGEVEQQTFDFDAGTGTLTARRSKEEADDYRYFPEPDLVPVEPPRELVERLRAEVPESPAARIRADRAGARPRRARRCSSPAGSTGCGTATVAAGADRSPPRTSSRTTLVGAGVDPARCARGELARLVDARERIPRAGLRRGDREARRARASAPIRTSRRRRSPTPTSSARSSTACSRRTPVRSRPTEAARRACSASSSAR